MAKKWKNEIECKKYKIQYKKSKQTDLRDIINNDHIPEIIQTGLVNCLCLLRALTRPANDNIPL